MKKRLLAIALAMGMGVSMMACGMETPEMSAAAREVPPEDAGITYIDEEAIALAGSVRAAEMTEAELLRADELRALAVSAFDLLNAERASRGFRHIPGTLIWSCVRRSVPQSAQAAFPIRGLTVWIITR